MDNNDDFISGHSRRDDSSYPTDTNQVTPIYQNRTPNQSQNQNQFVPSLQNQQQARIDAVYNEMSDTASETRREIDLMTEARTRFAKAALYEQIIEGMLFEGNDSVTLEVENEFKEFAESRLRVLLGIEAEKKHLAGLEEEEVTILKLFAAKLLGRPVSVPRPENVKTIGLVTQPRVAPPAPPVGQLAQPKRGRGRPPGTGKYQRQGQGQTQNQPTQAQTQNQNQNPNPNYISQQPQNQQNQQNQPTKVLVTLPNGTQREVSVQKKIVPTDNDIKPLPMPNEDEMVMKAMIDGERAAKASSSRIGVVPITATKVSYEG